jgi:serine/threonine protein phosphatase PrpC
MNEARFATAVAAAGRFRSSAASHEGAVRTRNEDSYVNRPDLGLWAVADGAGGHHSGDLASRIVTEALSAVPAGLGAAEVLAEVRLRVGSAHARLLEEAAQRGPEAMLVSTLVVLIARGDHFACLWAGDSRAYLLRERTFSQVTHDHSFVQELVDAGAIAAADALGHPNANIITRAVGTREDAFVLDKVSERLRPGDRFLLCSDGLSKTVPEEELAVLLAADDAGAGSFLAAALDRQADDNVTAVKVEVL